MRAIEFRYIVKFVQRMKDGKPISEEIKMKIFTIEEIVDDALDGWLRFELGTGYGTCKVLARQQYTGLQDAKGNKIFEGDIVRGAWSENLKPMVVEYQAPSFIMRISKKQWSEFIIHPEENQLYIVVGNKYQKELNEQK